MLDRSFLSWPFFEARHRALADPLEAWAVQNCTHIGHHDVDAACRGLVRKLGEDGWLKHTAPGDDPSEKIDVRTLALVRETLARYSGLAASRAAREKAPPPEPAPPPAGVTTEASAAKH